jgi:hypothetical protein
MALRLKGLFGKRKNSSSSTTSIKGAKENHLGFPQEIARVTIEKKGWRRLVPGRIYQKVLRWHGASRSSIPLSKSSFVEQNERMMRLREQVLNRANFPEEQFQRARHLFRLRKVARIASVTTGYCTRNASLALTKYIEEEMRERVKYAQRHPATFGETEAENLKTLKQILTAISKINKTTNVKGRMRVAQVKRNDFMALRIEQAETTEFALNPKAKTHSRIVDLGGFISEYLEMVIDERLQKVIGKDYYDEIKAQEIIEARRRKME